MRINTAIIFLIAGLIVIFALATAPYEDIINFDPVEWVVDSINGFLKLLEDLFFGWMK